MDGTLELRLELKLELEMELMEVRAIDLKLELLELELELEEVMFVSSYIAIRQLPPQYSDEFAVQTILQPPAYGVPGTIVVFTIVFPQKHSC